MGRLRCTCLKNCVYVNEPMKSAVSCLIPLSLELEGKECRVVAVCGERGGRVFLEAGEVTYHRREVCADDFLISLFFALLPFGCFCLVDHPCLGIIFRKKEMKERKWLVGLMGRRTNTR